MKKALVQTLRPLAAFAARLTSKIGGIRTDRDPIADAWLFEDRRHERTGETFAFPEAPSTLTAGAIHRMDMMERELQSLSSALRSVRRQVGRLAVAPNTLARNRDLEQDLFDQEYGQPAFVGTNELFDHNREDVKSVLFGAPAPAEDAFLFEPDDATGDNIPALNPATLAAFRHSSLHEGGAVLH